MEEFKGTQGLWKRDLSMANQRWNKGIQWAQIKDSKGRTIAEVKGPHFNIKSNEMRANARLIYTAPELLKALNLSNEHLKSIYDFQPVSVQKLLKIRIERNDKILKKAL
jgi:hypothetical protein